MKHIRDEVNLWEEHLVEDMRHVIEHMLNPLSLSLLSLTSKTNYTRYHVNGATTTAALLLQYGSNELLEKGYPRRLIWSLAFSTVASYGNLDTLKWLNEKKNQHCFNDNSLNNAIRSGNIDCMKWFINRGYHSDERSFNLAAYQGSLEIMQLLKERKCPWRWNTFSNAARHGNLSNMIWLKENGCPTNGYCFCEAVYHGSLTNLQWLKDKLGWPRCADLFLHAVVNGNLEIVKWLIDQGCPIMREDDALSASICRGALDILDWLKDDVGCELFAGLWKVPIRNATIPTLEWLYQNKCPWEPLIFGSKITENVNPMVLKWLEQHNLRIRTG